MDGIVYTYKACLVAKGYTQLYGVDYEETFSPVANIRAIRILISIAAYYDYEIWQMDMKRSFLNGYLDEDIYMVQPEGQIGAIHLGMNRALQNWAPDQFGSSLKEAGFLTRGSRIVERKKPGKEKARKSF
nr:putative retrotransposon Ty1-copia subclass protein [Tanacetum cinerariifolium]